MARAVARDPRILVLDDALSAVDTHTEARILDDLTRVMEGRTSFIISHRVSAVMNADLILVLDGGRIVERGRHPDLIARRGDLRPAAPPANARAGHRGDGGRGGRGTEGRRETAAREEPDRRCVRSFLKRTWSRNPLENR